VPGWVAGLRLLGAGRFSTFASIGCHRRTSAGELAGIVDRTTAGDGGEPVTEEASPFRTAPGSLVVRSRQNAAFVQAFPSEWTVHSCRSLPCKSTLRSCVRPKLKNYPLKVARVDRTGILSWAHLHITFTAHRCRSTLQAHCWIIRDEISTFPTRRYRPRVLTVSTRCHGASSRSETCLESRSSTVRI
jgi:hypothetical protein